MIKILNSCLIKYFKVKLTLVSRVSFTLLLSLSLYTAHGQTVSKDSIAMFLDIDDVVVTAQYAPTSSKNALQSIRTIDRATILQRGANNLEQLLNQDPNIRINQDLILGSGLSLLGVGGENIKIMIDGVPVVGRLDGNIDLSQINLNNIQRVEIIEGPVSVIYGTDAIGGVINLITKKSQLLPFELTLSQQLETRAENSSSVDVGFRPSDRFLVRLNGGRDWFDGYSPDTLRSVLWNPKEQWFFDGLLRYDSESGHSLKYQYAYFDEEVQNLGNVRRPQFKPYAFDDVYSTLRTNHALTHDGQIGQNYYIQTTLGANTFDRIVESTRLDFEEDLTTNLGIDTTNFTTYILRSALSSRFRNKKINFQIGTDLRYETGSGGRIFDPESDNTSESYIEDYALFGSLRLQPRRDLVLEGGLRASYNTRFDVPLIPSFHFKYNWTDQ
ncbi:MAG: TonB-dependent receptor plug domain-containing protein, partial [Bacteroidota bacterium]